MLLLVNPVNPARTGLTVNKSSRFPPIGLGIVAALTSEHWETFAYHEADLVGITAFTASANRAYEIAATYREQGVPVVMGGIHALMCTEETAWPRVVADVEARRLQRVYRGAWADLAGLPRPRPICPSGRRVSSGRCRQSSGPASPSEAGPRFGRCVPQCGLPCWRPFFVVQSPGGGRLEPLATGLRLLPQHSHRLGWVSEALAVT
jgi:hypothetical protein